MWERMRWIWIAWGFWDEIKLSIVVEILFGIWFTKVLVVDSCARLKQSFIKGLFMQIYDFCSRLKQIWCCTFWLCWKKHFQLKMIFCIPLSVNFGQNCLRRVGFMAMRAFMIKTTACYIFWRVCYDVSLGQFLVVFCLNQAYISMISKTITEYDDIMVP